LFDRPLKLRKSRVVGLGGRAALGGRVDT
jgi:hypothetical protein